MRNRLAELLRATWFATLVAAAALALSIWLPYRLIPADPWTAASGAVRAQTRPGDLVLLVPSSKAGLVPLFEPSWTVAVDGNALPTAFSGERILVVTDESALAAPAGSELVERWHRAPVRIFELRSPGGDPGGP